MKKIKLTRKRRKWVEQRQAKGITLKGRPLRNPVGIEERYSQALQALVRKMMQEVEREVEKIYQTEEAKRYFLPERGQAMDASVSSMARKILNQLNKKYSKMFGKASKILAERMVSQVGNESATNLHNSLKVISGGLSIKTKIFSGDVSETFKASISSNVSLIKSIQQEYLDKVSDAVFRSISSGNGMADLKPFFEKQHGMTERRARNIALDQTRKAYNSINADRMRKVGIQKFEWVHSGGGHKPREFHVEQYPAGLNGGIFSVDDPPVVDPDTGERGLPGHLPNCKCVMRPILDLGEEQSAE